MAFPVFASFKYNTGTADPYNGDYPDGLVAGDLILLLHANRGRRPTNAPSGTGWVTQVRPYGGTGNTGFDLTYMWAKKVSNGTESGTQFSVLIPSGGEGWVYYCLRITGWGGTLGSTFDNAATCGDVCVDFAEGNSNQPNAPSLNPATWAAEDALWIACHGIRESAGGFSSGPSGYTMTGPVSAGDIIHGFGTKGLNAASDDPGVATYGGGDSWIASTVAVRATPPPPPTIVRDIRMV